MKKCYDILVVIDSIGFVLDVAKECLHSKKISITNKKEATDIIYVESNSISSFAVISRPIDNRFICLYWFLS